MKALVFATVLTIGCWGSVAQAADPEITANSIIRAFSNFCDPTAFDRERPAGAQWDANLELNYGRLLFTKYQGNCERFENAEVGPARATFQLLANLPELLVTSPRTLSGDELGLVASALLVEEVLAGGCAATASEIASLPQLRSLIAGLRQKLTRDDAFDLARAYSSNRLIFRSAHGALPRMKVATPCAVAPQVAAITVLNAVNLGLMLNDGAAPTDHEGMSSEEFERFGEQLSQDTEQQGAAGEANEASSDSAVVTDSSVGNYTWEPGDPGTNRGNDDKPIDLTSRVSATDVAAIRSVAGRWNTTAACDEFEFIVGQFQWEGDKPIFDRGVPRIEAGDLSCEVGLFSTKGSVLTFDGLCHDNGGTWRGTGSFDHISPEAVDLRLYDEPKPLHLFRCGN